jgi:hypothetical protein
MPVLESINQPFFLRTPSSHFIHPSLNPTLIAANNHITFHPPINQTKSMTPTAKFGGPAERCKWKTRDRKRVFDKDCGKYGHTFRLQTNFPWFKDKETFTKYPNKSADREHCVRVWELNEDKHRYDPEKSDSEAEEEDEEHGEDEEGEEENGGK